jgi:hypothetical protein
MAFTNSCQWGKDDPRETQPIDALPPATQTGQATFGCLVNGAPMVAREEWSHSDNTFLKYYVLINDTTSMVSIEASTEVRRAIIIIDNLSYRSIRLQINDVADTNIRFLRLAPLNQNSANTFTAELRISEVTNGASLNGASLNDTWSKSGDTGTLEITQFRRPNPNIRGDRGAVSGRFSFVINHSTAGSFNVTDGRFDFPLISR